MDRCETCKSYFVDTELGERTLSGFICGTCLKSFDRKAKTHGELRAWLDSELAYVRKQAFRIHKDSIERIW